MNGLHVVCAIDVGTTRTKAALVDEHGAMHAFGEVATPGSAAGEPDHAINGERLSDAVSTLLSDLRAQASPGATVEGLCVTGQRATFFARDQGGRALAALSWQDVRAAEDVATLARELDGDRYQAITGVPHSPISVLSRMRWLRRCRPDVVRATRSIAFVADTVLQALGAPEGVMDASNASATGLWDLSQGAWSHALLALVELKAQQLPRVVPAGTVVGGLAGEVARVTGLREGTPLVVGGGDQPLASLGMGVLEPGQVGLCLGTSADLTSLVCGVAEPAPGRICTAHVLPGLSLQEGFMGCFGAALDWGRGFLRAAAFEPGLVAEVCREDDPLFLPFLNGIVTPDFAPTVRGGLVGLASHHGPATVARAIREGLALEIRRILDFFVLPGGGETILACGAAVREPVLLSRVATVTGRPIVVYETLEATLMGAACLCWYGLGRFSSPLEAARAMLPGSSLRHDPGPMGPNLSRRYAAYCRWVTRLMQER